MTNHMLRLALSFVLALPAVQTSASEMTQDPISSPSIKSSQVAKLLMNSVVRAGNRLVACGERGVILISDDNGASWHQATAVPVSVTLTKIFFVNEHKGWAIGHSGVVLTTSDGGEHWITQLDGNRAAAIENDAAKAEGTDKQRIRQSDYLVQDGADKPFLGIHFTDELNGIVTGAYGLAFKTENGGQTWQSIIGRIADKSGRHLYDVVSLNHEIFIVGEQGAFFHSTDGGLTFEAKNLKWNGTLFGILPIGEQKIITYGLRGHAFLSLDHGISWGPLDLPESSIVSGQVLSDRMIVLVEESGHILSSNDGLTFDLREIPVTAPIADFVEAADQSLIFAGINNLSRQSLE